MKLSFLAEWWNGVFYEILEILHKIKNIFIFYCRDPFNQELSVSKCLIVMDKPMFCTLG